MPFSVPTLSPAATPASSTSTSTSSPVSATSDPTRPLPMTPTIFPADLAALSVDQLAALPAHRKHEIDHNLQAAMDFLKKVRAKFDAALELCYGEKARLARVDEGKDYGIVHLADGNQRITVDVPKRVSWDQAMLAALARKITEVGERVEDYIDIHMSVSEKRFNAWPPTLRQQFAPARTVKAGKTVFSIAPAVEV